MSERIDVQYFAESGTWVRPPGAVRVDYLICAGGGGGSVGIGGIGRGGEDAAVHAGSFFDPDELPERVEVVVGRGGRGAEFEHVKAGDGADGYALFLASGTVGAPQRGHSVDHAWARNLHGAHQRPALVPRKWRPLAEPARRPRCRTAG